MAKHPAIFLDRDGTIIEDKGYIKNPLEIEFYQNSIKALRILQNHFLLFIITNQSGISKGIISRNEVDEVNNFITKKLKARGITIYDIFCCPHQDIDNCNCKKPNPHFIHHAARLYNLDLTQSLIIGDHPSDIECGVNAGITPIYLLSGHGSRHKIELEHDVKICEDILNATKYILNLK